jgi:hypothetical protein
MNICSLPIFAGEWLQRGQSHVLALRSPHFFFNLGIDVALISTAQSRFRRSGRNLFFVRTGAGTILSAPILKTLNQLVLAALTGQGQ